MPAGDGGPGGPGGNVAGQRAARSLCSAPGGTCRRGDGRHGPVGPPVGTAHYAVVIAAPLSRLLYFFLLFPSFFHPRFGLLFPKAGLRCGFLSRGFHWNPNRLLPFGHSAPLRGVRIPGVQPQQENNSQLPPTLSETTGLRLPGTPCIVQIV